MEKVLVYGTLRPGNPNNEIVKVRGKMYGLGWFPGIKLTSMSDQESMDFITCEVVEVDESLLSALDCYEGYNPASPESSLYIRRSLNGYWIYEYNGDVKDDQFIKSGDWLEFTDKDRGSNCHLISQSEVI